MAGKESFLGAFARIAEGVLGSAPDGPKNVWLAIAPWVNDLTRNASVHWLPHLLTGIPCEVVFRDPQSGVSSRCPGPAIAACSVCRKPCCINHSFVSRSCQAVCFACVQQDIDDHAPKINWPPGTRGHSAGQGSAAPHPNGAQGQPGPHAPPPNPRSDPLDVQIARARKILRVKRSATWDEVRAAHRRLVFKLHPDKNPGDSAAALRFNEVQIAFRVLTQAYEAKSP